MKGSKKTFVVPQLAWYNPKNMEISLPESWQAETFLIAGHARPELKPEEIRSAIMNPIETKPLREMARGKEEVVIVFDDMSRVTRAAKIVPTILEELCAAGIRDDQIQFICAVGMHAALYRQDMVKKLGEEVVARFRCFNHHPFANCTYVGTTKTYQTRLSINAEYLKCDLKIVIGSCTPHPNAGFGGGSKIIMPGISSFESILWTHARLFAPAAPGGMGKADGNIFKRDADECAELAGIDFLVNSLANLWGEPTAVYAGDWRLTYAAAVKEALVHYRVPRPAPKDIIIANSYAKANEAGIGVGVALPLANKAGRNGASIVIIANAPEGQLPHYLLGHWGKRTAGALTMPAPAEYPAYINQIICYSEYPYPGSCCCGEGPRIKYLSNWDEVIRALQKFHGDGTTVGIIADATNQYFD
jgi:lactate racemase